MSTAVLCAYNCSHKSNNLEEVSDKPQKEYVSFSEDMQTLQQRTVLSFSGCMTLLRYLLASRHDSIVSIVTKLWVG
jgi:hypothetical protein